MSIADLAADNLKGYLIGALSKGQFETAVPTGRIPFVATEDIARAAFKAITEDIVNKHLIVVGPELLTYDEVSAMLIANRRSLTTDYSFQYAKIASKVLGRTIAHRAVSPEELLEIKGPWARWLIIFETEIEKDGLEEGWFNLSAEDAEKEGIEVFRGNTTVQEWIEKNKVDLK
jgi:festuclavine dehydrogenase